MRESSCATREAIDKAATRRGCVIPIMPGFSVGGGGGGLISISSWEDVHRWHERVFTTSRTSKPSFV